ncbi:MAG: hypothetical protein AB8I08_19215 [Sandaracinaceae bacterium]
MATDVEAFLPSLEKARSAKAELTARVWWRRKSIDLLAEEPTSLDRLAVLYLTATAPETAPFSYPYVPLMPFALEEGVRQLFERHEGLLPESLRVDLERRGAGDPYRGTSGRTTEFNGFAYEQALEAARSRLIGLRKAHGKAADVRVYAWPVLRLSYQRIGLRREVAILVRPDGVMHAMLSRGRWSAPRR